MLNLNSAITPFVEFSILNCLLHVRRTKENKNWRSFNEADFFVYLHQLVTNLLNQIQDKHL